MDASKDQVCLLEGMEEKPHQVQSTAKARDSTVSSLAVGKLAKVLLQNCGRRGALKSAHYCQARRTGMDKLL